MDFIYEQKLKQQGHVFIAGIDEAGRGPLAGPVVAAAVIFDFDKIPKNLRAVADSKKLTPKKRLELFPIITRSATAFSLGICDHQTIDRINILQATFLAMKKSLSALSQMPDIILIDGNQKLPNHTGAQQCIINGDNLIFSIACASILAKVARDRIMEQMHTLYPQYQFNRHKGYGTKLHMESLQIYGPCAIHRQTFEPVKKLLRSKHKI